MAKDYELHPEKRKKLVNFKVSDTEFAKLEAHCKKLKVNVSVFIRHVVFNEIE